MNMPRRLSMFLLVATAAYIAGRTRSIPETPHLTAGFDLQAYRLDAPRLNIDLRNVTRAEAVKWLANSYGVKIEIETGIDELPDFIVEDRISLQIAQSNLHEALVRLGSDSKRGRVYAYVLRGDAIVLLPIDRAIESRVVRLYELHPLYEKMYGRPVPHDIKSPPQRNTSGLFGSMNAPTPKPDSRYPDYPDFVALVAELVRANVDEGGWLEDGGQMGHLHESAGLLVVYHEPYAQAKVASYLNTLAATPIVVRAEEARR